MAIFERQAPSTTVRAVGKTLVFTLGKEGSELSARRFLAGVPEPPDIVRPRPQPSPRAVATQANPAVREEQRQPEGMARLLRRR
jgi:hypothetical protein